MKSTLPTGFEPVTFRLTVDCSRPTELGKQDMCEGIHTKYVYTIFFGILTQ